MVTTEVKIAKQGGLHARPAATFVSLANQFSSEIFVVRGEKEVNAKSILSLLSLAATEGSTITLKCIGDDENDAANQLSEFLQTPGE